MKFTIYYSADVTSKCTVEAKNEDEAREAFWNGEIENDTEIETVEQNIESIEKEG